MPLLNEAWSDARLNLDSLDADIKKAEQKIRKAIQQMERQLRVSLEIDTDEAERQLDKFVQDAKAAKERIEANAAKLAIEIDSSMAEAEEMGARIRAAVEDGYGGEDLIIGVEPNLTDAVVAGRKAREAVEEGFGTGDLSAGVDSRSQDPVIGLDTSDFEATYAAVRARLEELDAGRWNPQVQADIAEAVAEIERIRVELMELDRMRIDVEIDIDLEEANRAAAAARERLEATLQGIEDVVVQFGAEMRPFDQAILDIEESIARLTYDRKEVPFDADTDRATRAITRLQGQIDRLTSKVYDIDVDLEGQVELLATIGEIEAALNAIAREDLRLNIDVDLDGVADAMTELAALRLAVLGASGDVDIDVDVDRSVFDRVKEQLAGVQASISQVASDAQGAFSGIGSSVLSGLKVPAIAGAVLALLPAVAAPLLAGIGALIGGAIALLASSAVAGLAGLGLPLLAVILNDEVKDHLMDLIEPLKETLFSEFAEITKFISTDVAPAFIGAFEQLIPVAAQFAGQMITPISEALLNLVQQLGPIIEQVTGPMGEGIASIIDTLARFMPTFAGITLAIGPPLTDAVNAVLEVVLQLADVFAGDMGSGFQVIADLFRDMLPDLEKFAGFLTPTLQLLGALIASIVEAGAVIAEEFGDQLTNDFQSLASNMQLLTSLMIAFGSGLATVIHMFATFTEGVADASEFVLRQIGSIVDVIGSAVGATIRVAGGVIADTLDIALNGIDLLLDGVEALDRLPGVGRIIPDAKGAREALEGARGGVDSLRSGLNSAGDTATTFGETFRLSTQLAAQGTEELRKSHLEAMEAGRLSASAMAAEIEAMNARVRTGEITLGDFSEKLLDMGDAMSGKALKAFEDFNKAVGEGKLGVDALGESISEFQGKIPTASDLLGEDNSSIVAAVRTRGDVIASELNKMDTILQAKRAGQLDIATFLGDLTPEQVEAAVNELGGVTSDAFAFTNEVLKNQANAGGTIIQDAIVAQGEALKNGFEKAKLQANLAAAGWFNLSDMVAAVDPSQIGTVIAEFEGVGLAELERMEGEMSARAALYAQATQQETDRHVEAARQRAATAMFRIRQELSVGAGSAIGAVAGMNSVGGIGAGAGAAAGDPVETVVAGLTAGVERVRSVGQETGRAYAEGLGSSLTESAEAATAGAADQTAAALGTGEQWATAGTAAGQAFVLAAATAILGATATLNAGAQGAGALAAASFIIGFSMPLAAISAILGVALAAAVAGLDGFALAAGGAVGRAFALGYIAAIFGVGIALMRGATTAAAIALLATLSQFADVGTQAGIAFGIAAGSAISATSAFVIAIALGVGMAVGGAFVVGAAAGSANLGAVVRGNVVTGLSGLNDSAYQSGYGVGQAFASGLQAGMNAGLANVRRTAVAMAQEIASAVKAELVVRSPSRVMAEIGRQVAEGLAEGIDSGVGRVAGASIGLAAEIPAQVTAAAQQANTYTSTSSTSTDRSTTTTIETMNVYTNDPLGFSRTINDDILKRRPG